MRDVAAGKTAKDEKTKLQGRRIVRGGEIVANRVHALLSKMFELAEDWKYRPAGSNPCRGAKRFAEHKVERFLSAEELSHLGAALNAAKEGRLVVEVDAPITVPEKRKRGGQRRIGPRSENPYAVAAIQLLLLTGCRLGEILELRWSHVDFERRLLLLPDSKTGAKTVYLSRRRCECCPISSGLKAIRTFSWGNGGRSCFDRSASRGRIFARRRVSKFSGRMICATASRASGLRAASVCQ